MEDMLKFMLETQNKKEVSNILACNEKSEKFGLQLSIEEVTVLLQERKRVLKETGRVEMGVGILPEIIQEFCDSDYIHSDNYKATLEELQEIFYVYKNETKDELTDSELLQFMRKQFDEICFGDLEYLKTTCLERFARAVRSGYHSEMQKRLRDEYETRPPENEYRRFDEEIRWEEEVYKQKLEDLF